MKITVKSRPSFSYKSEEEWLNEMEEIGYRLVTVYTHSLTNEVKYYFRKYEA